MRSMLYPWPHGITQYGLRASVSRCRPLKGIRYFLRQNDAFPPRTTLTCTPTESSSGNITCHYYYY